VTEESREKQQWILSQNFEHFTLKSQAETGEGYDDRNNDDDNGHTDDQDEGDIVAADNVSRVRDGDDVDTVRVRSSLEMDKTTIRLDQKLVTVMIRDEEVTLLSMIHINTVILSHQ